jgi:DSF synthase
MNALHDAARLINASTYETLSTRFDTEEGVLWTYMQPHDRPCFTPGLLDDLWRHYSGVEQCQHILQEGRLQLVKYDVLASKIAGIFNLGGDLALFQQLIVAKDRAGLFAYARSCVGLMCQRLKGYGSKVTTISLVQGHALGGGMECALASSYVVAEKGAKLGLPEVTFNLFPGMGAYSILSRKLGPQRAEDFILSGRLYDATELKEMNLIDEVVNDGEGELAVYDFIRAHARQSKSRSAMRRVRDCVNPITHEEMLKIAEVWVDAALELDARELRMMQRLVRSQDKKTAIARNDTALSTVAA